LVRFAEGGSAGMTLILICLLLAIFFGYRSFTYLKKDESNFQKFLKMTNQIVLLGLVISFANSLLGLITAFDAIEATGGDVEPAIIAGGLKVALLSPLFGLCTFIIGRVITFSLTWLSKAE
jgi:ethanolamine transporter EutH